MEIKKTTTQSITTVYERNLVSAELLVKDGKFRSLNVGIRQKREGSLGYHLYLEDLGAALDLGAIIREIVMDHPDGIDTE